MLRCCTVHVQRKMVSSDVQRMVSVERTLIGVRDPVDAFGWQGAVGGEDACVEGHLDGGERSRTKKMTRCFLVGQQRRDNLIQQ